jgi:glycosyltransferase involved in cell wall biosynthesis
MADSPSVEAGKRIALVCDWCLPRFGGLELQLIDLARALRAAGHHVEIITSTPGPDSLDGIRVRRLRGMRFPYFNFTCSPTQFREFRAILATGEFDVVHVQSGIIAPLAYGCTRIAANAGLPTVVTFHSVYDYLEPALELLGKAGHAATLPVAYTAVSSHVARETARALGAPVEVLPNGIDAGSWKSTMPHQRAPDEFRLVSVMRLQVRKRPRDLFKIIEAAQRAIGNRTHITIDIIGDGPERFIVDRLAEVAGVDRVRVHGRKSREEIRAIFATSDAFLLPTRMESFGIAALEALCAGLPVITRRNTGMEDFVADRKNGLLCGSWEDMAAAVAELATNEPLRAQIAQTNRATTPPYGWADIVVAAMGQYARAELLQGSKDP